MRAPPHTHPAPPYCFTHPLLHAHMLWSSTPSLPFPPLCLGPHHVVRATQLEGEHRLQVLTFEQHAVAARLAQLARFLKRGLIL